MASAVPLPFPSALPQAVSNGPRAGIPQPARIVFKIYYPPELPPINTVLHLSLLLPLSSGASGMHERREERGEEQLFPELPADLSGRCFTPGRETAGV